MAWQAATVGEGRGDDGTTGDGMASGHGRRRAETTEATAWRATVAGWRDKDKGQGQCSGYKAHTVPGTETKFPGRRQVYRSIRGALAGGTKTCPRPPNLTTPN